MLDPDWLYTELIPEAQFYLLLPFAASPWTSLHYLSFYCQERETSEKPFEIAHRPCAPIMTPHPLFLTNAVIDVHIKLL